MFLAVAAPLAVAASAHTAARPSAQIALHNPTRWEGPTVVELPTGRIAAPGLLDWRRVRLTANGKAIPFAIREGRAHWKARLLSPPAEARPEDLLVFSCKVPAGGSLTVDLFAAGGRTSRRALRETGGVLSVAYPGLAMQVDRATGMLTALRVHGEELLAHPFSVTPYELDAKGYEMKGPVSVSYSTAEVVLHKGAAGAYRAQLAASSSNAAMTELHFVLTSDRGPTMALTYRVHAAGVVEIVLDERPWSGTSPWLNHCVVPDLAIAGSRASFPRLESRWPFYGFREYTASVKGCARVHVGRKGGLLELGDEIVNGRQFVRRLVAFRAPEAARAEQLAEVCDEGLAVSVEPVRTDAAHPPVRTRVVDAADAGTREGDGYAIVALPDGSVETRSLTRLGLTSAAKEIEQHAARYGPDAGVPLVARNPVVSVRGVGPGGGGHEVDFPYGSDDEWKRVFDGLLASGMNTIACLGMWSNWKMPVEFRYMPELRSTAPDAYDESSGAKFVEVAAQREHGKALAAYLHERGARVWLWLPIGCVPTTFAKLHPEAMAPGSDKIPCFTHPEYRRYVDAFLRELTETYAIDGIFMIRDDNGGICTCDRCKDTVAHSRTHSPVWEQYLVIYDWLRSHQFAGDVAVYPYNDPYMPELDPLLPADLYVMGHGAGAAVLARNYEFVGPMGDTWIDNLYANFRLAPSPRMRRLLADRGSFWLGGAYCGTELPWEAIGAFGWEPTATPNTLRYDWGAREFGTANALAFVRFNQAYEHLWDIAALEMLPTNWMALSPQRRAEVVKEGDEWAGHLRTALADLKTAAGAGKMDRWFAHTQLYAPFFQYHLHRLDRFAAIHDRVLANRAKLDQPGGLPDDVRRAILDDYRDMLAWAAKYDAVLKRAPGAMLEQCKWMSRPYKEWMAGYDQWFDWTLKMPQFAGTGKLTVAPIRAGEKAIVTVELHNQGICPWFEGQGQRVELGGDAAKLGLPSAWEFAGEPMAPGDTRRIELRGAAPAAAGAYKVTASLLAPFSVSKLYTAQCEVVVEVK